MQVCVQLQGGADPCWVLYRCSPVVQAAAKACVDKGEVPYYRHDWKGLVNEVVCFPKEEETTR